MRTADEGRRQETRESNAGSRLHTDAVNKHTVRKQTQYTLRLSKCAEERGVRDQGRGPV